MKMWFLSLSPSSLWKYLSGLCVQTALIRCAKGWFTSWAGRSVDSVRFHHATQNDVNSKLISYMLLEVSISYLRP